ncbi:MAG: hypothetical protein E4H28_00570 [Gemmatimonadales bacterium]|nr:MAG: hypothetical protein E4H28_00570 [Gemmatimonadales bacterium]
MAYAEFLAEWFNLPFVGAVVVGSILALRQHRQVRASWVPAAVFAAGIIGLTINGAIHDLALGSSAERFPFVFVLATVTGTGLAFAGSRILRRAFPPVTGVTWNQPGLEGSTAQIVTATSGRGSRGGRARVRDADGVVHVVRIHAPGGSLRFGRRVRLGPFDDSRSAYPVEPL